MIHVVINKALTPDNPVCSFTSQNKQPITSEPHIPLLSLNKQQKPA